MIEEYNFRCHSYYKESKTDKPKEGPKTHCSLKTNDKAIILPSESRKVDSFIRTNEECDGENNCILYQIYKQNQPKRNQLTPLEEEHYASDMRKYLRKEQKELHD